MVGLNIFLRIKVEGQKLSEEHLETGLQRKLPQTPLADARSFHNASYSAVAAGQLQLMLTGGGASARAAQRLPDASLGPLLVIVF